MKSLVFYRSIDARDNLELFLVSAISSLLLVRFYLYITGYPQIGRGSYHIAHVLIGGLFMLLGIIMLLSFLGRRTQRLAAGVAGIGFGVFIDELGKFVTRDNNYFFRPTVGIIYAIFISLYLLFSFLSKTSKLSSAEYQLNALLQLEEAVRNDLDPYEKRAIKQLLAKADKHSVMTLELQQLIARLETVPVPRRRFGNRILAKGNLAYHHFWQRRNSSQLVALLFIVETATFLLLVVGSIFSNIDSANHFLQNPTNYGQGLVFGQLLTSLVAGSYALVGVYKLRTSRLEAFERFRMATLINLFLTEFFIFARIQFGAIPSFTVNLLLLLALRYAIYQEERGQTAGLSAS